MYHEITLVGYLGSDPEMRYTPEGAPVANFSVATSRKWTNQDGTQGEETVWWRVTTWRRLAETCNEYLHKGSPVLIKGRMRPGENGSPRIWFGRDGEARASYEITASMVRFLPNKNGTVESIPEEPKNSLDDSQETPF